MSAIKYIVLDDDPTGVQCIHDLPVYTDWSVQTLREALTSDYPMSFILTNSRALTEAQTVDLHRELAGNLLAAARQTGVRFQLISRGDSTLRGHFPLETDTLRAVFEKDGLLVFDGEIICPVFVEAGRITRNSVHYAKVGAEYLPVSATEFACDKTFGYKNSDLRDYIVEKSGGLVRRESIISVDLELLRSGNAKELKDILASASGRKIVVDSENYDDLDRFAAVVRELVAAGRNFIYRTAASFTRSIIAQLPIPLLRRHDLIDAQSNPGQGGLVFVGSHTAKTTAQLEVLLALPGILPIEFEVDAVFDTVRRAEQHKNIVRLADKALVNGKTCVIYTERQLLFSASAEQSLLLSVAISEALASIAASITAKPAYIVAKGGITSNDIAIKGLGVKKAMVAGQIAPGVPVWILSAESRFPGIPYIICPGNTGEPDLLARICEELG